MGSLLSQDLQPSRAGRRLLEGWPLVFALAVLGGLVGLGVDWVIPARYEATATVGIGPDPNLVAPYSKNVQYEADLRAQDLLLSDSTLELALQNMSSVDSGISAGTLRSHIRLDHVEGTWYLRVYGSSPAVAAAQANAWAKAGIAEFEDAQSHALKAGEFQALLFSVACQPQTVIDQQQANLWSCDEMSLDVKPDQVSAELLNEARLSRGIMPGLTISSIGRAIPPESPTRQTRALLCLGGAIAGLAIGLMIVWAGAEWKRLLPFKPRNR